MAVQLDVVLVHRVQLNVVGLPEQLPVRRTVAPTVGSPFAAANVQATDDVGGATGGTVGTACQAMGINTVGPEPDALDGVTE